LRVTDHLTIVGSLAEFLNGEKRSVGDVDVLIDGDVCKRYWEFLEILTLHGIKSVYDVFEPPNFAWYPCCQDIAHALSLTLDCCTNRLMSIRDPVSMKHANLDICIKADDLGGIPDSSKWVCLLERKHLLDWNESTKDKEISEDHQKLIHKLAEKEETLEEPCFQAELGLRYAVKRSGG